jgi:hypothetical protein
MGMSIIFRELGNDKKNINKSEIFEIGASSVGYEFLNIIHEIPILVKYDKKVICAGFMGFIISAVDLKKIINHVDNKQIDKYDHLGLIEFLEFMLSTSKAMYFYVQGCN